MTGGGLSTPAYPSASELLPITAPKAEEIWECLVTSIEAKVLEKAFPGCSHCEILNHLFLECSKNKPYQNRQVEIVQGPGKGETGTVKRHMPTKYPSKKTLERYYSLTPFGQTLFWNQGIDGFAVIVENQKGQKWVSATKIKIL